MKTRTERLYLDDPYKVEFQASFVEKIVCKGKPAVVLDRTCFYPESGGQPSDRGTIEDAQVIRVFEKGGDVFHVLDGEIPQETVRGKIDWKRRFDHMQQHAGQHILSQSFQEIFQAKTLSFHLGELISTIELDLREISGKQLEQAEDRASSIVFENREIKTHFLSEEDAENIPLRKPSKKKGVIRVVEIVDFDYSACGGTHPLQTGEVGLIKVLKWERIRDNVRLEFVCGKRALRDYGFRNSILRQVALKFSASENDVASSVDKLFADFKNQKKTINGLQKDLIQYETRDILRNAEGNIIQKVFSGRSRKEIRFLALNIINQSSCCVLFGLREGERAYLILSRPEKIPLDMRKLVPLVSPFINGRGGGSPFLVEIAGDRMDGLEKALEEAEAFVKKNLDAPD